MRGTGKVKLGATRQTRHERLAGTSDEFIDHTTAMAVEERAKLKKHFTRFLICTVVCVDTLCLVAAHARRRARAPFNPAPVEKSIGYRTRGWTSTAPTMGELCQHARLSHDDR